MYNSYQHVWNCLIGNATAEKQLQQQSDKKVSEPNVLQNSNHMFENCFVDKATGEKQLQAQ